TPAFLETVSMEDSLVIRAVFDDYVDVASLESAQGTVVREGANAPEVLEILPLAVWRARSAEPDDPLPPNALRPTRPLAIVLSRPLLPEVEYRVEVAGIANVNGVPEGGGSQPLEVAAPPAPPPPADAPQGLDPDAPPPEPAGAPGPADGPPAGTPDPTP